MATLEQFTFRISRDCTVFICMSGQPTQEAIDKFVLILQEMKDTFPVEAVSSATPAHERQGE